MHFEWLATGEGWVSLATLTLLETVLGIDNVIFISILAGKLPAGEQGRARRTGLALALVTRLMLLGALSWMVKLTAPLFHLGAHGVSGRDLILLGGGLFLIAKSTMEIHERLEGGHGHGAGGRRAGFWGIIAQILVLDMVFSLDSVITAIGMANELSIMVLAVVIALGVMLAFAGAISDFVHRHPTVKMLALSFLLMIGFTLVAEGCHQHVEKGYIYAAMAFSVFVEMLNLRMRNKGEAVKLHQRYEDV